MIAGERLLLSSGLRAFSEEVFKSNQAGAALTQHGFSTTASHRPFNGTFGVRLVWFLAWRVRGRRQAFSFLSTSLSSSPQLPSFLQHLPPDVSTPQPSSWRPGFFFPFLLSISLPPQPFPPATPFPLVLTIGCLPAWSTGSSGYRAPGFFSSSSLSSYPLFLLPQPFPPATPFPLVVTIMAFDGLSAGGTLCGEVLGLVSRYWQKVFVWVPQRHQPLRAAFLQLRIFDLLRSSVCPLRTRSRRSGLSFF